jgi:hypothetical protein
MAARKKHSEHQWRRLEARMVQAKRSQVDRRLHRAVIWAILAGALLLLAIHWLANHTG